MRNVGGYVMLCAYVVMCDRAPLPYVTAQPDAIFALSAARALLVFCALVGRAVEVSAGGGGGGGGSLLAGLTNLHPVQ